MSLIAVVALSFFTSSPVSLASPVQSAARPAPQASAESEVLFLWSAGRDALLADARDAGLATALGMLDARLAELARDLDDPSFPADALRLVNRLVSGPACLRIERVAPAPGAPPLWFQLAFRARDAETARRNVEELAQLAAKAGVPLERMKDKAEPKATTLAAMTPLGPLVLAARGDALVLALGEPRTESFASPAALPGGAAPVLHARWNGRVAGELLAPFVMFGGPEAQRAWRLVEVLGVVGASAPARSWTFGLAADRALVHSVATGWAAGGDGALDVAPLDAADFARVPPDATFAELRQLRPRSLLALAQSLDAGSNAGAALQKSLGLDLDELLALFGPTAGAFASLTTGGGGLASGVAFVETTDAARAEALLGRLGELVATFSTGPAQGRVAVRTTEQAGTRFHTLVFPGLPVPLELTFAVHGDALWLALRPSALTAAFASATGERSLLRHPRLAPLAAEVPADAISFGFFDAPYYLEHGYGTASALSAMLANALRSPYDPAREPGTILPPFAALRAGSRASVSWSRLVGADLVGTASFDRSLVANATVSFGLPLSGIYGSTAGLAMVSSIAIPRLMSARHAANEAAAIASLRALSSAQAQFSAVGVLDEDKDGQGEYGFLGELSGARALRGQRERLNPPVLASSFGALQDDGDGDGVVQRAGYWFQVWLPTRTGAIAERSTPNAAVKVNVDAAEVAWCAFAWPVEPGSTGRRAFFVDQEGDIFACDNADGTFGGLQATGGRQPAFDIGLTRAVRGAGANLRRASDGTQWRALE